MDGLAGIGLNCHRLTNMHSSGKYVNPFSKGKQGRPL